MELSFELHIDPPRTTHQQKKIAVINGKPVYYQPDRLKNAVSALGWSLAQHRPKTPLNGPVALVTRWKFKGKRMKPGWKITRPDTDNLQKALKDELGKLGFYHDDAQVVHEVCEKVWADVPGIEIKLWELEPNDSEVHNRQGKEGRYNRGGTAHERAGR